VTINTGASVTVVRLDITVGLPEGDLAMPYNLQMASEEILLILKEVLVKLTLGQCPLTTCVYVAGVVDEFNRGLDVHAQYILGFEAPCGMTRQLSAIVGPWGATTSIPLSEKKQ
jgi:hypothetical protein